MALPVLCVCVLLTLSPVFAGEPIYIALSAPITGNYAEYGANFKKAIDLGIKQINAAAQRTELTSKKTGLAEYQSRITPNGKSVEPKRQT